ncbi:MAG TPA: hypothetical protein VFQ31_05310 [Methyloceanibacter sp.]|nr:hypothetical protein [Methyloceanibacter sp.]
MTEIDGEGYVRIASNGWRRLRDGHSFFVRAGQTLEEFLAKIEAEKQDSSRVLF